MRTNLSVLMAALALGVAATALAAPVSSGGGSSSSGGFAPSGGSTAGGAGSSSSSGSSAGTSSGGGGGASAGHGGNGGGTAHTGGGWASHGGTGVARGNGAFAGAHPVFGMGGQRLPELHALTHGAAIAVLSEAKARPPHPIHPTHPLHPKPARVVRTGYNDFCTGPYGCGSLYSNLFTCDPDRQAVPHRFNCRPIRKSELEDFSHAGP